MSHDVVTFDVDRDVSTAYCNTSKFFRKRCVRIKKRLFIGNKKTSRELEGKKLNEICYLLRYKAVMELNRMFDKWCLETRRFLKWHDWQKIPLGKIYHVFFGFSSNIFSNFRKCTQFFIGYSRSSPKPPHVFIFSCSSTLS